MPLHAETPAAPGLGPAPEGQRRLDAILHVELAVLYFPFRQGPKVKSTRKKNEGLLAMLPVKRRDPCSGLPRIATYHPSASPA
jgi:hypothetical protein